MELQPGQRLGGFEIVQHVKSGGMASLYLARRQGAAGFSRPVAIKIVHQELAKDPKFIRMFLDEARLAVLIQHPNVVQVEELLEVGGTYMMVMEYVHGTSLFDVLRRLARQGRRLSPEIAVWIASRVADGLHAAHELRAPDGRLLEVVHRDISPQNILLSYSGHVKVIDFGIAKSQQRTDLTRTGVIRGKLGYMSPEQANAQPVDRRTDVYALGIVLWEMLTSRRLFKGQSEVELLDKVRNPRVARPSLYGHVPPALENVVMDALTPPVDMRTTSAMEMRDKLLRSLPEAGAMHSSTLAGLLSTVMSDTMEEGPLSWEEAGLTGDGPAEPSRSFLAAHTVHASAPDFTSTEMDEEDLATVVSQEVPFMMPGGGTAGPAVAGGSHPDLTVQSGPFPVAPSGPVPVPMPGVPPGMPRPPMPRPSGPTPTPIATGPTPGPISAAAALPMPTPQPMEPPSHTQPRRLVQRPAHQSNSFAQFQAPPPSMGAGTADSGSLDFEVDPRSIVYSDQQPKQESKAAGCLVQIISMTVLVLALAIAVVLLYRAGLFHELLGDPVQPIEGPAADPNAPGENIPANPNPPDPTVDPTQQPAGSTVVAPTME